MELHADNIWISTQLSPAILHIIKVLQLSVILISEDHKIITIYLISNILYCTPRDVGVLGGFNFISGRPNYV